MTIETRCAICGKEQSSTILASTNTFGPPDLDLRPAEMMRSSMVYWVQECVACGYCSSDLSEGLDEEEKVLVQGMMGGKAFTALKSPEGNGGLANRFLRQALALESKKDLAGTGWAYVHAAWAFDDAQDLVNARHARSEAISQFLICQETGVPFVDGTGAGEVLLVDLMRRSGDLGAAMQHCRMALGNVREGLLRSILCFEMELIERGDDACHDLSELPPKEKREDFDIEKGY